MLGLPFEPRFNVGNVVQLARYGEAFTVIWRGEILVPHAGGWYREWVYRLDHNYWDCYYQDELHPAWRWTSG